MWITRKIPENLASNFSKSLPFNALVLLDANNAERACELIRDAEGPRHIDIELSRLGGRANQERKSLQDFLEELQSKILELAPEQDSTEFDPGFFNLNLSGVGLKQGSTSRRVKAGTPEPVPGVNLPSYHKGRGGSKSRPNPNGLNRLGRRARVKSTITRKSGGIQINTQPIEDIENAELRIVVSNGADSTCDNPKPDTYLEIGRKVILNGEARRQFKSLPNSKKRVAVHLGKITADSPEQVIWVPCKKIPEGELRAEFLHRAKQKQTEK